MVFHGASSEHKAVIKNLAMTSLFLVLTEIVLRSGVRII